MLPLEVATALHFSSKVPIHRAATPRQVTFRGRVILDPDLNTELPGSTTNRIVSLVLIYHAIPTSQILYILPRLGSAEQVFHTVPADIILVSS